MSALRLLTPFNAYREDQERALGRDSRSPHDAAWLLITNLLCNVGQLDAARRAQVLLNHERALAGVLGPRAGELPPDHPFAWVARFRAALTTDPLRADHDRVSTVVLAASEAMERTGLCHLAYAALEAVRRAFPAAGETIRARIALACSRFQRVAER